VAVPAMDMRNFFPAARKPTATKPAATKSVAREPVPRPKKKKGSEGSEPLKPACILGVELPLDISGGALAGSALVAFQLLDMIDAVPPPPDPADITKAYKVHFLPTPLTVVNI
jgi:hypothetical protein